MTRRIAGTLSAVVLYQALGACVSAALADNFYLNLHGGPRYLMDAGLSRDPHGQLRLTRIVAR